MTDPAIDVNEGHDQLTILNNRKQVLEFNTTKKDWEQIKIIHGELPQLGGHEMFVHGAKLFIMGGRCNGQVTADCFVVHLLTGEIERVTPMD